MSSPYHTETRNRMELLPSGIYRLHQESWGWWETWGPDGSTPPRMLSTTTTDKFYELVRDISEADAFDDPSLIVGKFVLINPHTKTFQEFVEIR